LNGGDLGSLTTGSVLFKGASGIAQDNDKLFWDDTNKRLGIGVASPSTTLDVSGATNLDGAVTINESGADVDFRVEGVGEANALFVQGSNGFVGIGTTSPTRKLHIQEGNIRIINSLLNL